MLSATNIIYNQQCMISTRPALCVRSCARMPNVLFGTGCGGGLPFRVRAWQVGGHRPVILNKTYVRVHSCDLVGGQGGLLTIVVHTNGEWAATNLKIIRKLLRRHRSMLIDAETVCASPNRALRLKTRRKAYPCIYGTCIVHEHCASLLSMYHASHARRLRVPLHRHRHGTIMVMGSYRSISSSCALQAAVARLWRPVHTLP